jgi:hypothetical protein
MQTTTVVIFFLFPVFLWKKQRDNIYREPDFNDVPPLLIETPGGNTDYDDDPK